MEPPEPYQPILNGEPRLSMIKKELESLLQLIDFEHNGESVEVDGFRLKNLDAFRSVVVNLPLDSLGALSGLCNCDCEFCFERNHPYIQDKSFLSIDEARTRIKYYHPQSGTALFLPGRVYKEPFLNPHAIQILKMLREVDPDGLFWLTTNGSMLTEVEVANLAQLLPIGLTLSLNCKDFEFRKRIMGEGSRSDISIALPGLLRDYKIPFIGSVVAWPSIFPDEFIETLHYLDQYEPYAIRIRLPIYHKYSHPSPPFDDFFWDKVISKCQEIRSSFLSPLFIEPPPYWINPILPEIDGVIRNSPAAGCLQAGDRIVTIEGETVSTRSQALGLLMKYDSQGQQCLRMEVMKKGENHKKEVVLDGHQGKYPYHPEIHIAEERYGLLLLDDLNIAQIQKVCDLILEYDSNFTLLFSRKKVASIAQIVMSAIPKYISFFQERKLQFEILTQMEAGGNLNRMDGRSIEDFIHHLQKAVPNYDQPPDLILIPNAFSNPWGMDLSRVSLMEIERQFNVPVEMIDWPIEFGKEK